MYKRQDYTWSDPYLNNEQVMVVTSDSGIETLADLAGKNVVVQAASAALDALNSDDNKDLTDSFASVSYTHLKPLSGDYLYHCCIHKW